MALSGHEEFIQGKIFGPFENDCQVRGRGKLIQVYDPDTRAGQAYWEYEDEENRDTGFVPAGAKVRVVKAHVAFLSLASQASP